MNNKAVIDFITSWLKEKVHSARKEGFILGVSVGIDSAVTSTLAAATGYKTVCLELPIHQEEKQVSRAQKHIEFLKDSVIIFSEG